MPLAVLWPSLDVVVRLCSIGLNDVPISLVQMAWMSFSYACQSGKLKGGMEHALFLFAQNVRHGCLSSCFYVLISRTILLLFFIITVSLTVYLT